MKKGDDDLKKSFMQIIKFVLIITVILGVSEYQNDPKAFSVQDAGSKYNSDKGDTSQLAAENVEDVDLTNSIYLVTSNDVTVISNEGKETKLKQGEFTIIPDEKTKYSLSEHGYFKSMDGLAKVPKDIAKDSFYIQFKPKNTDLTGTEVLTKLPTDYNMVNLVTTFKKFSNTSKIQLPAVETTRITHLFKGKFIAFTENGTRYYIPESDVIWSVRSVRDLNLVSRYTAGRRVAQEKVTHITDDITQPTGLSAEELDKALAGTGLDGLGHAFQAMEERWGVNALFGIAVAAHESAWGTSYLAKSRNNLFGIAAYDGNEGAAYGFETRNACIDHWGEMIKEVYFDRGYTNIYAVNSIYASDKSWSTKVQATMASMRHKILN